MGLEVQDAALPRCEAWLKEFSITLSALRERSKYGRIQAQMQTLNVMTSPPLAHIPEQRGQILYSELRGFPKHIISTLSSNPRHSSFPLQILFLLLLLPMSLKGFCASKTSTTSVVCN
jgi:hypothetical protein